MYAVVKFVKEDTVSEIPDTWLEGINKCWWPSKNAKQLIQKGIAPETRSSHWQKYDVVIEATCLSYEVARRKAMQYVSSSDESSKGRGKRHVVPTVNNNYIYDSDSESASVLSSIPKLARPVLTKAKVMSTSTTHRKKESSSQPQEDTTRLKYYTSSTKVNSQPILDISNAEIITVEQLYEEQENDAESITVFQDEFYNSESDAPEHNDNLNAEPVKSITNNDSGKNGDRTDNEILRLLIKISLQLDSIDQRITNLEKRNKQVEHEENRFQFIKDLLPMTFDTMAHVDGILASNMDIVKELKDFMHTIGGNNPRDNIHRILSNLFTNECATKCSWKGYRNNRQVFNLKVITLMKEVIVGNYTYMTQHEIEHISSEWFRFARQRYDREKKKQGSQDEGTDRQVDRLS